MVRPAAVPLCSMIVCKSASTWHGWNPSESAFTTGTDEKAASLVEALLPVGPLHDGVDEAREDSRGVGERLVAAHLRRPGVDDDGMPAELGDPHIEGEAGAWSSCRTARRRRVGRRAVAARTAQLSPQPRPALWACSSGVRSSSRRKWRVMVVLLARCRGWRAGRR